MINVAVINLKSLIKGFIKCIIIFIIIFIIINKTKQIDISSINNVFSINNEKLIDNTIILSSYLNQNYSQKESGLKKF